MFLFLHSSLIKFGLGKIGGLFGAGGGGGGGVRGFDDRPTAIKWSKEQLAGARVHLAHGHTQAQHEWLKPEFVAAARADAPMMGITGPSGPCVWPWRVDPNTGRCDLFMGDQPGPNGAGHPVMVPAGAPGGPPPGKQVTAPTMTQRLVRRCPAGFVLGRDLLCYWHLPRNSKWRKWRPGRKPAFTGGDLNAISKAAALSETAEDLFKKTNPAKKSVAKNYRSSWRKPLKK